MLTLYRIELRRSPLFTVFPLLLAVDIAVLFGRTRYWIGIWPEASVAAQVVTIFLAPLVAAVSAHEAGRSARSRMPEVLLAAACPRWKVESVRLAATLTLAFVAYGVGAATAAAVSYAEAGPGFLWPSYLLLGISTLTGYAAIGHFSGRFWPSPWFTPVVCALGSFITLTAAGQSLGFVVLTGPPDVTMRPAAIALRLLLAFLLAVLAVCVPDIRGLLGNVRLQPISWKLRGATLTVVIAALITIGGLPAAGEIRQARNPSAVQPICAQAEKSAPFVCIWPEHRKYLPQLMYMAKRLADIPQGWVKVPSGFYEAGLHPSSLGDIGFEITDGHVRSAAIAMAAEVSNLSFNQCLPPDNAIRAWQASDSIDLWLEYRAMGVAPTVADKGLRIEGVSISQGAARSIVVESEAKQRAWTSQERAALRKVGCSA
ncbi:ABC transporter permease [Streptomyces sp. NPDC088760]|uniref:DUF7224 domain-containing protein n=1 Tax=Streptomyces sp. NPDC088760 TaxID=3365890 RepID=UPI0037F5016D